MADPYIGEIRMFGGNYSPVGWEFCNGQLLPISEYDALYTLLGTTYGGDGQSTFGLPDLRSRIAFGAGTRIQLGERGGTEEVALHGGQLPTHTHAVAASVGPATSTDPQGRVWSGWADTPYTESGPTVSMSPSAVSVAGGSQPHENRPPFLAMSFIIAVYGIYPTSA